MLKDQRAITPILKYLDDDLDTKPVGAAILALGRLKAEQAVLRIAEIYHTATNTNLWRCCSRALAEIGNQQAFATLVYELEHGTPEKQHDAALAFGNMETVENIEPLLAALKNSETNVRRAIVISLGNLRDSRAIPALTEALDDPDEQIREYVLNALDKIREANES